jgi:hypothetical protein
MKIGSTGVEVKRQIKRNLVKNLIMNQIMNQIIIIIKIKKVYLRILLMV